MKKYVIAFLMCWATIAWSGDVPYTPATEITPKLAQIDRDRITPFVVNEPVWKFLTRIPDDQRRNSKIKLIFKKGTTEKPRQMADWIENSWDGQQYQKALALFPVLDKLVDADKTAIKDNKYIILHISTSSSQTKAIYSDRDFNKSSGFTYLPGDANMHNGVWPPSVIGSDVTYLVNYFRGSDSNQPCYLNGFWASADANGDCNIIGSDVTYLINYLRNGRFPPTYCPDCPPRWPIADDLPAEVPEGWPNCE